MTSPLPPPQRSAIKVQWLFAVAVMCGILVISAAVQMDQQQRRDGEFESAFRSVHDIRLKLASSTAPTQSPVQPIIVIKPNDLARTVIKAATTRRPTLAPTAAHAQSTAAPTPEPPPSVHLEFAQQVKTMLLLPQASASRTVVFSPKLYHFHGGKEQVKRYFKQRKWNVLFKPVSNMSEDEEAPLADVVISPCIAPVPRATEGAAVVVSAREGDFEMKRVHAQAMNNGECGVPWLLDTINQCNHTSSSSSPVALFVKHKAAPFARYSAEPCPALLRRATTSYVFPHAAVDGALARAFILVSSYAPLLTVWYALAYAVRLGELSTLRAGVSPLLFANNATAAALARRNIKRAAFASLVAILPELRAATSTTRAFTLFNVDLVVYADGTVRVLELGCNAELVNNHNKVGLQLVQESTQLVDGMLDLVVAAHFAPPQQDEFTPMLRAYAASCTQEEQEDGAAPPPPLANSTAWELLLLEDKDEKQGFAFADVKAPPCAVV